MIPDDYYNYAVERSVLISVSDDFTSGESPTQVYAFSVSGEDVESHDTIPKALLDHLYGKDGFSIDEHRSILECGASCAIQEISLAVVSGIAGGLATYAVSLLKGWRKSSSTVLPDSEEGIIEQLTGTIEKAYNPDGELTVLEEKPEGNEFTALIRDSHDVKFHCSVDRETGFITISRGERT